MRTNSRSLIKMNQGVGCVAATPSSGLWGRTAAGRGGGELGPCSLPTGLVSAAPTHSLFCGSFLSWLPKGQCAGEIPEVTSCVNYSCPGQLPWGELGRFRLHSGPCLQSPFCFLGSALGDGEGRLQLCTPRGGGWTRWVSLGAWAKWGCCLKVNAQHPQRWTAF